MSNRQPNGHITMSELSPELYQDIRQLIASNGDTGNIINIIDNLITTTKGNALDARQGKVLDDKITELSTDRGYRSSKLFSSGDFNNITYNGFFKMYQCANAPIIGDFGFELISGFEHSKLGTQICVCVYGTAKGNMYLRTCNNGIWSDWDKVLTSQKSIISLPMNSGFSESPNMKSYLSKTNNKVSISARIVKSDGSNFTANSSGIVATVPSSYKPASIHGNTYRYLDCVLLSADGTQSAVIGGIAYITCSSGALTVSIPNVSNIKCIFITEQDYEI